MTQAFIEKQFPASKVSKESYKERKANNGQTLTGLGKWWGRKPLVLVRAAILGCLMPATDNPKKDMDYWTEAIVFTTSNNSFGPTEISYLENRFCKLAIEAKRYAVKNGNDPTQGHITEEKESELEEFIDYAKIVMGTLGHKVFEKLVSAFQNKGGSTESHAEQVVFELKQGSSDISSLQGWLIYLETGQRVYMDYVHENVNETELIKAISKHY